jgi:CheY-like chemotaxis protein
VIHADDASPFLASWTACIVSGKRFEAECRIHRRGEGYGWHLCRATPVCDGTGHVAGWYGTSTYVDTQKKERDELVIASDAKDRFLAMLSHELRTPLTPCLLIIAALETDSALPAHLMENVQMLRRNIEHEQQLVGDLVDVSAALHGKLPLRCEVIDFQKMLMHVVEVSKAEMDAKAIELTFACSDLHLPVVADRVRLRQVLCNLLRNAIKFTPAGGKIEIGATDISGTLIRVWVKDNGIGIDPQVLPRLFVPFQQADASTASKYGGLGLGLAIARNIAELHQGSLYAESDGLGHGATFVLEIPVLPPSRLPKGWSSDAPQFAVAHVPPMAILLVEDHLDTASAMCRLLQALSHEVTCVHTATAALAVARLQAFDLILSDIQLPDLSGWEFLRELRTFSRVPAIAVSGCGSADYRVRAAKAGFQHYLVKPVQPADVRQCLAEAFAGNCMQRHL